MKKKIKILNYLFIFFLAIGLSVSLQSILAAWVAPGATPPASNVNPPINESLTDQAKLGGLSLGGALSVSGNSAFLDYVGIGTTTPNRTLHIYRDAGSNAEIDLQSVAGANKHWALYQDRTTEDLRFWNNTPAGEKNIFTLTDEGYIGIGTTNPSQRLDVAGNIHASGDICTDAGGGKCLSSGALSSASFKSVVDMSLRHYATCALLSDGTVKCWGHNVYGKLGLGDAYDRHLPVTLPLENIKQMALGAYHGCAVNTSGNAWCWGHDGQGQLGDGGANLDHSYAPVQVQGLNNIESLVIGNWNYAHTCALTTAGNVYCWGHNGEGQLGDGTIVAKGTPVAVLTAPGSPLNNIKAIDLGYGDLNYNSYSCALSNSGAVWCWGYNAYGQIGVGNNSPDHQAYAQFTGIDNAVKMKTGGGNGGTVCALLTDKTLKCWGYNAYGQVGNGTNVDAMSPVSILTNVKDFDISHGGSYTHACALLENGEVKCWGYNGYGQVGDGSQTSRNIPVNVKDRVTGANLVMSDAKEIKLSNASDGATNGVAGNSCVYSDSEIKCWGYNAIGEVGVGYLSSAETMAAKVIGLKNIKTLRPYSYGGYGHLCAVLNDGRAQCWGYNAEGQVGIGDAVSTTFPVFVKTLNTD